MRSRRGRCSRRAWFRSRSGRRFPRATRRDEPERDAAIVFTSGTTGRPKGAVLTRGNQLASARASGAVLPLGPGDRWLASLPFFHVGGLGIVHRCLRSGACVVLPAASILQIMIVIGLTRWTNVARLVRDAVQALGGIDILINNAGIACQEPFLDISLDHWDRTLAINLRGEQPFGKPNP